jgi:hypothetical protein
MSTSRWAAAVGAAWAVAIVLLIWGSAERSPEVQRWGLFAAAPALAGSFHLSIRWLARRVDRLRRSMNKAADAGYLAARDRQYHDTVSRIPRPRSS